MQHAWWTNQYVWQRIVFSVNNIFHRRLLLWIQIEHRVTAKINKSGIYQQIYYVISMISIDVIP